MYIPGFLFICCLLVLLGAAPQLIKHEEHARVSGSDGNMFGLRFDHSYSRPEGVLPGGVLGISSDGDVRRIFLGLKCSIPGFFWIGKLGKYVWGGLI